jgi:hypothetical protein
VFLFLPQEPVFVPRLLFYCNPEQTAGKLRKEELPPTQTGIAFSLLISFKNLVQRKTSNDIKVGFFRYGNDALPENNNCRFFYGGKVNDERRGIG